VRSHLGGTNAPGKSATCIASKIADGAAQNKKPLVSHDFLTYTAASDGMLLSWDFGMADAGRDPFLQRGVPAIGEFRSAGANSPTPRWVRLLGESCRAVYQLGKAALDPGCVKTLCVV